jgi:hypothetical protein
MTKLIPRRDDEWDPEEAWRRAGEIPEGFEVNPLWEQARQMVHSTPGLKGGVTLDWPNPAQGPCAACGSYAYTSYRGRPVHMSCAGELALFVDLVSKQRQLEGGTYSDQSGRGRYRPKRLR